MTELDDDREGIEPETQGEDAGDPAAAFDALRQTVEDIAGDLRREMTTIRKGVEAAFEEFDRHGPPQDYKPELAQLVQQLAQLGECLQGVEQSPVLRQGAEHYARALERSGEGLVQNAARALEKQAATSSAPAGTFLRMSPVRGSAGGKIGGWSRLAPPAFLPARC